MKHAQMVADYSLANSDIICDNPAPFTDNFDAAAYMGTWYEIDHVSGQPFQPDSWTCNTAQYYGLTAEGTFTVYNSSQGRFENPRFGVKGNAKCTDSTGQCYVTFFDAPWTAAPNYVILQTDYDNYSVIYECGADGNPDFAYLWFMSRTPTVDQAQMDLYYEIAREKVPDFDLSSMAAPDRQDSGCKYADLPSEAQYIIS